MEWFKRFFAFGVLAFQCVCVCVCARVSKCVQLYISVSEFGAHSFREKKDFVRSTRPGEVMATGRRRSTRLLCSLLLVLSLVQLLARGSVA